MKRFINVLQTLSKDRDLTVSFDIRTGSRDGYRGDLLRMLVSTYAPDGTRFGKGVMITSDEWESAFTEFETLMVGLLEENVKKLDEHMRMGEETTE